MTYKNFPVYIGHGNRSFTSQFGYHKSHMIYAERANVNYSTASVPNRKLGQPINRDREFAYTADLGCSISFDFLLYPNPREWAGNTVYSFLSDSNEFDQDNAYVRGNNSGSNFFPIKIGGNFYNKCFLTSYNIEISALNAVRCSANFSCYDPPSQKAVKADNFTPFESYSEYMSGNAVVDGASCQISGLYDDFMDSEIIPKVSYSKSYNITPVYNLGNTKPNNFLVDSIEAQMVVESTGLNNLFAYDGIKLQNDIGVNILNHDGERILPEYDGGFDIVVGSGAKVNVEDYGIQGGDVVSSRATIQEILL